MTNEEAISVLEQMKDPLPGFIEISRTQFNEWQALNIAIEAIKEKSMHDKVQTIGRLDDSISNLECLQCYRGKQIRYNCPHFVGIDTKEDEE